MFAFSVLWRTRLVMVLWYGHVGCRCAVQVWVYGVCVRGIRFQCWIFGFDMVAEIGAHSGAGTNNRLRSESRYAIPMCSKMGRGPLKHHPVGFKDTGGGPIQYLPRCELRLMGWRTSGLRQIQCTTTKGRAKTKKTEHKHLSTRGNTIHNRLKKIQKNDIK